MIDYLDRSHQQPPPGAGVAAAAHVPAPRRDIGAYTEELALRVQRKRRQLGGALAGLRAAAAALEAAADRDAAFFRDLQALQRVWNVKRAGSAWFVDVAYLRHHSAPTSRVALLQSPASGELHAECRLPGRNRCGVGTLRAEGEAFAVKSATGRAAVHALLLEYQAALFEQFGARAVIAASKGAGTGAGAGRSDSLRVQDLAALGPHLAEPGGAGRALLRQRCLAALRSGMPGRTSAGAADVRACLGALRHAEAAGELLGALLAMAGGAEAGPRGWLEVRYLPVPDRDVAAALVAVEAPRPGGAGRRELVLVTRGDGIFVEGGADVLAGGAGRAGNSKLAVAEVEALLLGLLHEGEAR